MVPGLVGRRARTLSWLLAAARALLGVGAIVAPARPSAAWVGREEADRPAVRLFARALGGRDLALGLGCLLALRNGSGARRWLEAGALADVGDTFATVVTFAALPRRSRYGILAITLGAGLGGLVLAPLIEPAGTPAPSPMS